MNTLGHIMIVASLWLYTIFMSHRELFLGTSRTTAKLRFSILIHGFGIQYKVRKSSFYSLIGISIDDIITCDLTTIRLYQNLSFACSATRVLRNATISD